MYDADRGTLISMRMRFRIFLHYSRALGLFDEPLSRRRSCHLFCIALSPSYQAFCSRVTSPVVLQDVDRFAFFRDIISYIVATIVIIIVVWDGWVSLGSS